MPSDKSSVIVQKDRESGTPTPPTEERESGERCCEDGMFGEDHPCRKSNPADCAPAPADADWPESIRSTIADLHSAAYATPEQWIARLSDGIATDDIILDRDQMRCFLAELRAEIARLKAEVERWRELASECFAQGTFQHFYRSGMHNHLFISAYEHTQCALIDAGVIRADECEYACCDRHLTDATKEQKGETNG